MCLPILSDLLNADVAQSILLCQEKVRDRLVKEQFISRVQRTGANPVQNKLHGPATNGGPPCAVRGTLDQTIF